MSRIEMLEEQWRKAIAEEAPESVENIVREVLREHPKTALASEIRYKRGVLQLTEGVGLGSERLARALHEFEEGARSADVVGAEAEPWRSLNRTQIAACLARRHNFDAAIQELKKVAEYRPHNIAGLGALSLLVKLLLENNRVIEAKRFRTQRLSYARTIVRENADSPEINLMKFLLAQELLDSPYKDEGQQLLRELSALAEEDLGPELYEEIQSFMSEYSL
jgi:hypothetical protein